MSRKHAARERVRKKDVCLNVRGAWQMDMLSENRVKDASKEGCVEDIIRVNFG